MEEGSIQTNIESMVLDLLDKIRNKKEKTFIEIPNRREKTTKKIHFRNLNSVRKFGTNLS